MTKLKNSEYDYLRFAGERDQIEDIDWLMFEFNSKDGDISKNYFLRFYLYPIENGPLEIAKSFRKAAELIEGAFEK